MTMVVAVGTGLGVCINILFGLAIFLFASVVLGGGIIFVMVFDFPSIVLVLKGLWGIICVEIRS